MPLDPGLRYGSLLDACVPGFPLFPSTPTNMAGESLAVLGCVTWDLSGDFDGTINGVSLEGGFVSINWVAKPNRSLTGPEVRISKPR